MAIIKNGSLTVATGGVAQNLGLGFYPTRFTMWNQTLTVAQPVTGGILSAFWMPQMSNGEAFIEKSYSVSVATTPPVDIQYSVQKILLTSNGITPYTTAGSSVFPSSNLTITGISQAANARITATHAFTSNDIGVTVVSFHNVVGMTQINTLSGVVQSITSTTSFTVNINTTSFTAYSSGGIANIVTGIPALQGGLITSGNAPGFPPAQTSTSQILNAPLYNTSILGLTLGSSLMVNTDDVWLYEAVLDADFTSA